MPTSSKTLTLDFMQTQKEEGKGTVPVSFDRRN